MKRVHRASLALLAATALAGVVVAAAQRHAVDDAAAMQPVAPRADVDTAAATAGRAPVAAPTLSVEFERGLLTVKARNVPLKEVLADIGAQARVGFTVDATADEPVFIDAGPRPVREVVASLLQHTAYGYAYLDGAPGGGAARVFLFRRGQTTTPAAAGTAPAPGRAADAVAAPAAPDAALQRQRAVDALFEACKAQACDTS